MMRGPVSSSTSSPTSTTSSTSERLARERSASGRHPPGRGAGLRGLVRIVHPFPSTLDGLVAGAVATLAGAPAPVALRSAVAMLALQGAIGALNDLHDREADSVAKPWKPIPSGWVSPRWAAAVVVLGSLVGLALAALSGPSLLAVAIVGLALGVAYDLALKGTFLSWLPFALGVPLLLVFGALSAGCLPTVLVAALPIAALSGAGLALSNALADVEGDAESGVRSVATVLGRSGAWRLAAASALLAIAGLVAGLVLLLPPRFAFPAPAGILLVAGTAFLGAGLLLSRSDRRRRRQAGWEVEAVGYALLGVAWLALLVAGRAIAC